MTQDRSGVPCRRFRAVAARMEREMSKLRMITVLLVCLGLFSGAFIISGAGRRPLGEAEKCGGKKCNVTTFSPLKNVKGRLVYFYVFEFGSPGSGGPGGMRSFRLVERDGGFCLQYELDVPERSAKNGEYSSLPCRGEKRLSEKELDGLSDFIKSCGALDLNGYSVETYGLPMCGDLVFSAGFSGGGSARFSCNGGAWPKGWEGVARKLFPYLEGLSGVCIEDFSVLNGFVGKRRFREAGGSRSCEVSVFRKDGRFLADLSAAGFGMSVRVRTSLRFDGEVAVAEFLEPLEGNDPSLSFDLGMPVFRLGKTGGEGGKIFLEGLCPCISTLAPMEESGNSGSAK